MQPNTSPLPPISITEGRAWLDNFQPEERGIAALLLNSLRIVSSTEFRAQLTRGLIETVSQLPQPVALYPVRAIRKEESEPSGISPRRTLPGSHAIVANIIRDILESPPGSARIYAEEQLEALREKQVRSILLVDDYSGSGTIALRCGGAWLRNPTIRSWKSYKFIGIHYFAFAVSGTAEQRIRKASIFDSVRYAEYGLDFDAARWTENEKSDVEVLCKKYAQTPSVALGLRKSRGLFVVQHTVPNNLPMIIWQRTGRDGAPWAPFFKNRRMSPAQQLYISGYSPKVDFSELAEEIGQRRLARQFSQKLKGESAGLKRLTLLLGALSAGHRNDNDLSVRLATSIASLEDLTRIGQQLGLIDGKRRLTDSGWAELRSARKQQGSAQVELTWCDEPYYPRQLRESQ
ncbi:hypothetical protein AB0A71_32745 [Kitasatospora aureofaciens]|uniref:phosphoribosyltransferase-like protein n=1 Tax=Kitasatospora aureofaciens TaxID=1894 RepID=UPI0033F0995B